MPDTPHQDRRFELSLSLAEQWTLHHVLLDRIEREKADSNPAAVEPPPVELFQAFDRLDAGERAFTAHQLEAIREVLSEYHHATSWWEVERPQIEALLRQVTELLDEERGGRATEEDPRQESNA